MANTNQARETQAKSPQSTVTNLTSNNSIVDPSNTSQTSKAPFKGSQALDHEQSSSLKSHENCPLADTDRAQDLAGFGSWAESAPGLFEESVKEVEDILNGELE